MKKILALVLTALMILSMTAAFAENGKVLNDGTGTAGAATTDVNALNIYKSVVVENPVANITVAYPSISFVYELASANPNGATVSDGSNTVPVFAGDMNAVSIRNENKTVTIAAGNVKLNKNGQEIVSAPLTIDVTPTAFANPGIYRYQITDNTPTANLTNKGVVRGSEVGSKVYYLDVYIKKHINDDGTEGNPEVAGYVLRHENTDIVPATGKDGGFDEVTVVTEENVPGTPGTPGTPTTSTNKLDDTKPVDASKNDMYYTYNATLTKNVSGSMGDRNHAFPFTLTVENKDLANDTLTYWVGEKNVIVDGDGNSTLVDNKNSASLKHEDYITIYGLNPYAKVNYSEENNTPSTYKVSVLDGKSYANTVKDKVETAAGASVVAFTETQNVVTYSATEKAANADALTVKYDNKLDDISPTGVVLRFAPYMAMLAAGIVLVLISRRRKESKDEQ